MSNKTPIKNFKKRANILLTVGTLMWLGGNVIRTIGEDFDVATLIGLLIFFVGWVTFVCGCVLYAKAKGRNPAWGLLGTTSLFGLFILFLLRDKSK